MSINAISNPLSVRLLQLAGTSQGRLVQGLQSVNGGDHDTGSGNDHDADDAGASVSSLDSGGSTTAHRGNVVNTTA